ncbi:MAG: ATP-binding protein [Acidobacteriota bacterium]
MVLVLNIFSLLLIVALGFYIFISDPRSRANQTFAGFNIFLAGWTIKDIMLWEFGSELHGLHWWLAISFCFGLLMQYSLAVFAWVFPENQRTPRVKAAVLFSPGLVLMPAAISGFLWNRDISTSSIPDFKLDPLAYLFAAYIAIISIYGVAILMSKWRQYRGSATGRQIGAVLAGIVITIVLQVAAVSSSIATGNVAPLRFTSILALPGVAVFAFAILKLRLFSLQTVLDGFRLFPIGYKTALQIATVAICSFIFIQLPIVWWAFGEGHDVYAWKKYVVLSIISALIPNICLALIVLRTYSRPLRRITVAAVKVTSGEHGAQVETRATNDEIGILGDAFNSMSRKMAEDIARLENITSQLMRTEKLAAIGRLSAGVSHEINNPLSAMLGAVRLLLDRDGLDPHVQTELRRISQQIERLSKVATDLMDFASSRPSVKTSVDINTLIIDTLRILSFDPRFKTFAVTTELSRNLPRVFADPERMQQVFLNILLNAKDAMDEGGLLVIKSDVDGEFVKIEMSDDGVGLPKDDETKIFDPFFSTKPEGDGTGLGLAVCFGIVTDHKGTISAKRNIPHGATFIVRLPSLLLRN